MAVVDGVIVMPYDWPGAPQLTGHADFWHPTGTSQTARDTPGISG